MNRDVGALNDHFDLLVIGGGIYGAWTAYDAALRGLKVALIEKGDWGSGTSSASTKLIHGGIRYLEQMDFGLVRKSLDERRRLATLAPHRVQPLRFLIPIYRNGRVGAWRMRLGLWLYDRLARGDQPVDPHRALGRDDVLHRCPFLGKEGLRCGFSYGDCQTDDFRFTLEIVAGAHAAGAVTANYVEAETLLEDNGRVCGARIWDRIGDTAFNCRASVVVNAAGAWATDLLSKAKSAVRRTKGVHLVLPPLPSNDAILLMTRDDRRVFFVIPWYGRTLVGTTDTDYRGDPDHVIVESEDVDYLLTESKRFLPGVDWDRAAICGRFAGIRTLHDDSGKPPSSVTREWSFSETRGALLTSMGGKFTSARADAAEIVDRAVVILGKPGGRPSPTATRPFPWCPADDYPAWLESTVEESIRRGLDRETAMWSAMRYGASINRIHKLVYSHPHLSDRIHPDLPFSKAEIVHGAREEMALTLEDLLRRRLPLILLARLDHRTLETAAALVAAELEWDNARYEKEIQDLRDSLGKAPANS